MRISSAKATNFKGFTDFDQTFGDVNCITGRNAEGKSSVLDILCAAFVTDGDRDLLRVGAEEGEILVVLQDGGETIEVRRSLKPGKISAPRLKSSAGGVMSAGATFLKQIVDSVTLDPIRQVMTAPPKEQLRILLETMPLEMDAALVLTAVDGLIPKAMLKLPSTGKANLDTIASAYDAIYAERTGVNRDAKTKGTHAAELKRSVEGWEPPEGKTWRERLDEIDQQLQDLAAGDSQKREAITKHHAEAVLCAKAAYTQAEEDIDREIDEQIGRLKEERARRKSVAGDVRADAIQDADESRVEMLEAVASSGSQDGRLRLIAEKAKAQQAAEQQARAEETIKIAAAAEADAAAFRKRAERLSEALDKLKDAKQSLLENLPIKGLQVANGVASLNGVPLGELNTAEKAKFWIRVAVLRAQERQLQVVIIDDAEHFDDQNWPMLLAACQKSGLQFFLSRVEPHDFKIEVI